MLQYWYFYRNGRIAAPMLFRAQGCLTALRETSLRGPYADDISPFCATVTG